MGRWARSERKVDASGAARWRAHYDGIPVRTSAGWKDPAPGLVEADLVAHSGPSARASFIQTLVLTDIATLLDEACAVAGARANAPEHRDDRSSPTAAALAAGHVSRRTSNSRVADPTARTTRRLSNRRTEPWSDGSLVIGGLKCSRRLRCSQNSIAQCACS